MTAVSERLRFRVESMVEDADYRDADSAIADAFNVALLAADPVAAKEREAARSAAVRAANGEHGAPTAHHRQASLVHRVFSIGSIVLGALAVGLIALSPRTGSAAFTLQAGAPVAGIVAVAAVGVMVWLEPMRRAGDLWGSHLPARIYLFFGVLWIGFAGTVVAFRWDEVDRREPWPVVLGLALFLGAGIVALILWWRGRGVGHAGRQPNGHHVLRGLADPAGADQVFDALDRWWAVAGPRAVAADPERLLASRQTVLAYLARTGLIDPAQERKAVRVQSFGQWKERRP